MVNSWALLKNGALLWGKLPVVKDHERRTPAEFQETGAPSQGQGNYGGIKLHQGPLPPVIVVDGTWVKVGGKGGLDLCGPGPPHPEGSLP